MENGSIVGQGMYNELIQKTNGSFANYIKTYLDTKESNKEDISKNSLFCFKDSTKLSFYNFIWCKKFMQKIHVFKNFMKRNFAISNFSKVRV